MGGFVVDASVALAWCFEDEATAWTDSLLDRLRAGDDLVVPAHWPTEVSNGLLFALRRQRIKPGQPELFWDQLANLPIEVEPPLSPALAKRVMAIAQQFALTVYDAAYLELAQRRVLGLATLDVQMSTAARTAGTELILAGKP
jgi:predicted nucleic acid-binding protein